MIFYIACSTKCRTSRTSTCSTTKPYINGIRHLERQRSSKNSLDESCYCDARYQLIRVTQSLAPPTWYEIIRLSLRQSDTREWRNQLKGILRGFDVVSREMHREIWFTIACRVHYSSSGSVFASYSHWRHMKMSNTHHWFILC